MRRLILATACLAASCSNGCAGSRGSKTEHDTARTSSAVGTSTGASALGMNLRFVSYSSTDWPFVNLMRMASPWISRTTEKWDDGRALAKDEHGAVKSLLPGQWAASLVPTITGGELLVIWEGKGTLVLENAKRIIEETEGRIRFEAKREEQIVLNLTSTDAKDPIRNLAVVPPEFEKTHQAQLFHPLFLERLKPFSVIRFLEWIHTNGSPVAKWEDRSVPDYVFQSTDAGVAYEYQIALGNRLGADIWIPIPHLATDDHVKKLAELLKAQLDPKLRVYVEWSNEVWNDSPAFTQAQYSRERGRAANLDSDENLARLLFQAERSVQVFTIFESVLPRERMVRVLAGQSGNAWAHQHMLKHGDAYEHVDALAIAPYFGNDVGSERKESWLKQSSAEQILDFLEKESLPEVMGWIRDSAKVAGEYHLDLIAYEGGQHLVASPSIHNNPGVNERLDEVNRHPRMKDLTLRLLEGWRAEGGKTFAYYAFVGPPGKWGRFGALEVIDQPSGAANKYDALLQFIRTNPRWW